MKLPTMPSLPESVKSVRGVINGVLPDKKTSLFMSLLILGLASYFLWHEKLDGVVWAGISGYILTVYVVRRVKGDQVRNGVNKLVIKPLTPPVTEETIGTKDLL